MCPGDLTSASVVAAITRPPKKSIRKNSNCNDVCDICVVLLDSYISITVWRKLLVMLRNIVWVNGMRNVCTSAYK